MKLRCSQLKCIVFQTEVTKNICCHFRNCHPCGWVTARRVEGGYPKYQRWPGAVKMRRGDFHESCVAGEGWCRLLSGAALVLSTISASPSRQARGEGQVLRSSPALPAATQLPAGLCGHTATAAGETADKRSRKNIF